MPQLAPNQRDVVNQPPTGIVNHATNAKTYRSFFLKNRKKLVRYSLIALNVAVLILVIGFIFKHPSAQVNQNQSSASLNQSDTAHNPLDTLSSADIAVHVARLTNLPEERAVTNNADSVNAQLNLASADTAVVAKPQIISTVVKTKSDIRTYTTVAGDTISKLAVKFNVTSDSIRWSNSLTSERITIGKVLYIPPDGLSGIVYVVKAGDTVDTLAQRFHADKADLSRFNDAEISGFKPGEIILVPNGSIVASSRATYSFAFLATYGSNGYDFGYCTWWAATRRQQIGHPLPSNLGNASSWKVYAQMAGIPIGNKPQAGAVVWTPPRDYLGHVAFVESVAEDGSVNISEMNVFGWNRVSYRTAPADVAAGYTYIYW